MMTSMGGTGSPFLNCPINPEIANDKFLIALGIIIIGLVFGLLYINGVMTTEETEEKSTESLFKIELTRLQQFSPDS